MGGAAHSGYSELRERFEARGQGHVFRFWDELDAAARERLLTQAAEIDLDPVLAAWESRREHAPPRLEPAPVERLPDRGGDVERWRLAAERGYELLAAGRVGAMVVAGGQATRLGYPGPKGTFPLGPVTGRTLFEQQAQKIRGLRRRYGAPMPWYVMTSHATDDATREAFEKADFFGLPRGDVFFLRQGMVASVDFDGKLILERPDRIFQNPDGHGGSLSALDDSGALDDAADRGIDTLFYFQVDNPLVRMADPAFLGLHALDEAEMSGKVVRKVRPEEKMGVVARLDGRLGVIEYTEIDDEHRNARDGDGQLVYWAGNVAIHVLDTGFVRRIAREADRLLPYHVSPKKIPTIDAEGEPVEPTEPNGYKLERFVFDALSAARAVCVVEADRETEYATVKNATGGESPETARRALVEAYRSWLAAAGIALPPADVALELDHSRVDGPDDARDLGIRSYDEAPDVIRVGKEAGG